MKTLLTLLSPLLLIAASHLTDAAAIAGAQKVDSAIGVPPPHPNVLLQKPSQWTETRDAAERAAAQAGGKAVGDAVGKAIGNLFGGGGFFVVPPPANHHWLLQRPSTWTDIRDAAEDAALKGLLGSLSGGGGFFVVPPPQQQQQQQPPAVHPHVLFQRPDQWSDVRNEAEHEIATEGGKKVGEEVGKAVGDQLSKGINALGNEIDDLLGGLFGR